MATTVEILQVECVVEDLVDCRTLVLPGADLELNYDYESTDQENRISSSANSRDLKLKEEMTAGKFAKARRRTSVC